MHPATHPSDSIEHFAEISARLDDPFGDRQAVLRAAGLDDERWAQLVEQWSARLGTDEGEALAERFGGAYAATRRRHIDPALEAAAEATAPRSLSTTAQPWRSDAASAGLGTMPASPPWSSVGAPTAQPPASRPSGHPLAGTTDVDWGSLRAALPFGPPPPSGVRLPPSAPLPPPPLGELGGTMPVGARLPAPVLPFQGVSTPPRHPAPVAPPSEPRSRK